MPTSDAIILCPRCLLERTCPACDREECGGTTDPRHQVCDLCQDRPLDLASLEPEQAEALGPILDRARREVLYLQAELAGLTFDSFRRARAHQDTLDQDIRDGRLATHQTRWRARVSLDLTRDDVGWHVWRTIAGITSREELHGPEAIEALAQLVEQHLAGYLVDPDEEAKRLELARQAAAELRRRTGDLTVAVQRLDEQARTRWERETAQLREQLETQRLNIEDLQRRLAVAGAELQRLEGRETERFEVRS